MALLLDNDVVEKLAQLDLLQEAKALLAAEFGQLIILDTLKYKLCPRNESKRKKRNATVMNRIENFIKEDIIEISCEIKDEELKNAIATNPAGLDAGEMQLLQALFESEKELLLTGDKRFLKALANIDALQEKLEQISGSFVCFEQVIYFLIRRLGFEQIKAKFLQALEAKIDIDKALKCCFEGREQAVEELVIKNLNNFYIDDIRRESGLLLSVSETWLPTFDN